MAGKLATPMQTNLRRDATNANRVLVRTTWTPDGTEDNQADMERFRIRYVYSAQAKPPNDAQIQGGDNQVDDANDDNNQTTGTPGGSKPRTAPDKDWNEASVPAEDGTGAQTYFYRDVYYERLSSDTDSDDDANTNIISVTGSGLSTSTRWQNAEGAGWVAPVIETEMVASVLADKYVWSYARCEVE